MKKEIITALAILSVALGVAGMAPTVYAEPAQTTTSSAAAVEENEFEQEVFELINAERSKNGLKALNSKSVLIQDARQRAIETVSVFSHTRPDGSNWWEMDPANMYSECLEWRKSEYATPQRVVEAWMDSKTHREALLREDLEAMGIGGYVDANTGRVYIVFEGGYTA